MKSHSSSQRSIFSLPLLLTLLCAHLPTLLAAAPPIHSIVPVECGLYFTWQSLGIFYSHRKVGQAGKITRVACCNDQEKEQYRDILHIVPTHVAPSYTVHPRTGDVYSAYNKPLAVLDFLTNNAVEEEYILVIDADMIFVQRFNPINMGVRPGWAVAAFFSYMRGVNNELALKHVPEVAPRNDTLAGPLGRRGDMCGGFTFMMRDDLARVAPLWLKYTEDVRFDEDAWRLSGDQYAIHPGDKPWISEMYGYSYGAAKADVWHIAAHGAMEYPEYELAEPPMVMHYGLEFTIPNTGYTWDKHWFYGFDALRCPPWGLDPKVRSMGGLFNHPPMPSQLKSKGMALMRDLYAIMTINTLNEALCERHFVKCPPHEEMERECAKVHMISEQVNQGLAYLEKEGVGACTDNDPRCGMWADAGECEKNPNYMGATCRLSCKVCSKSVGSMHLDDFRHAAWEDRYMKGTDATKTTTSTTSEPNTKQNEAPPVKQLPAGQQRREPESTTMTTGTTTTDGTTTTATTTTAGGVAKQQQQEEYEKQRVRQDAAAKLKQRQQELHAQLDSNTGQHVSELLVGGEVPRDGKHGDGSRVENKEGGNTHDGHHIPENVHHDTPTTTTTTGGGGNGGGGSGGGTTTGSTGAGGVLNKVGGVDVVTHVVDEVHHESVDPVTAPPLDPTIMGNGDAGVNGAVRAVQGGGNGGHGGDSDGEGNKKGKQEHPATQILMGKCARMQGLSSAQLSDCQHAASNGVLYEKPSGRVALEEQGHQHTVHQLHDDLKHKNGLVQHAAGGVGM